MTPEHHVREFNTGKHNSHLRKCKNVVVFMSISSLILQESRDCSRKHRYVTDQSTCNTRRATFLTAALFECIVSK